MASHSDPLPSGPVQADQDPLDVDSVLQGKNPPSRSAQYRFSDIPSETPFHCQWHIERRAGGGIALEGHLAGDLLLTCDSCEQPFLQPIALGIDELYVLSQYAEGSQSREKELQADDFYEVVEENGVIDLKDLAHQYLVMESAHHPTCQQAPCESASG
ncbi:MAG: DUF177 domain-containing protein [Vampirovibrionales bacterium]|nr:DUF177 domain-containing protein [Vampirovibrionales bacterium]